MYIYVQIGKEKTITRLISISVNQLETPLELLMGAASWKGTNSKPFIPFKINGCRFFPSAVPGAALFQRVMTLGQTRMGRKTVVV